MRYFFVAAQVLVWSCSASAQLLPATIPFSDGDWLSLGAGISGGHNSPPVVALAVSLNNLYAGGTFTTAGGLPATNIAKWDGRFWTALGSGLGGYDAPEAWALAVSETNLYVGGVFFTAGDVQVNSVARWDGRTWSALGDGPITLVYALAVIGNDLYEGGHSANNIYKWDGDSWSAVGSGVQGNYGAFALAADRAGHLFVGGWFSTAGTNAASNVALADIGCAPTMIWPPQSQTAEMGAAADFRSYAAANPPATYQWLFNATDFLGCGTNSRLDLINVDPSRDGAYTVVATNGVGAVTSAPAQLEVIPAVPHRPVPAIEVTGSAGSSLSLDYVDSLKPGPNWTTLGLVNLTRKSQFYFDLTEPLPPQRFYRAWQSGTPGVVPSLIVPGLVPMITLTGTVGDSLELDYINQYGPTNAWGTLGTITLTNTAQPYFDLSALHQPPRLP